MKSIRRGSLGAPDSRPGMALLSKAFAFAVVLALPGTVSAQTPVSPVAVEARSGVVRPNGTTSAYSVEIPLVVRTGGATSQAFRAVFPTTLVEITLQTSVDFINNTNLDGVLVNYQFSYTCVGPACSPQGGFYRTSVQQITLPGLGIFHQDDFVGYLASLGLLQPGADQGAVGTLLMTFSNLSSARGWEASAIGTTYSPMFQNYQYQPLGAARFAYPASLFFESADSTLIGFARNTSASPTPVGFLQPDLGIRNTDIRNTNLNVTVDLSFYDTATGQLVGNPVTFADIRPGEIRQMADIWTTAGIPSTVKSVIIFADARNPSLSSATFEGFVLLDGINRNQSLLEMHCADLNGCGF